LKSGRARASIPADVNIYDLCARYCPFVATAAKLNERDCSTLTPYASTNRYEPKLNSALSYIPTDRRRKQSSQSTPVKPRTVSTCVITYEFLPPIIWIATPVPIPIADGSHTQTLSNADTTTPRNLRPRMRARALLVLLGCIALVSVSWYVIDPDVDALRVARGFVPADVLPSLLTLF